MPNVHDVTLLLHRWRDGDQEALHQLLAALYGHLKRLARSRLTHERADHTLNTTALVHEAFLKLVDIKQIEWQDRAHFLAMASRVMRRVLVDYALMRKTLKRGGDAHEVAFDESLLMTDTQAETLLELEDVLQHLEDNHPRPSQAITLYHLGGLTQDEIAEALGVSQTTVVRDLRFGRAWLARAWEGDLTIFNRERA